MEKTEKEKKIDDQGANSKTRRYKYRDIREMQWIWKIFFIVEGKRILGFDEERDVLCGGFAGTRKMEIGEVPIWKATLGKKQKATLGMNFLMEINRIDLTNNNLISWIKRFNWKSKRKIYVSSLFLVMTS